MTPTLTAERVTLQYCDDVLSGKTLACKWAKLACERHLRDLKTGADRGLVWRAKSAQFVLDFFGLLRHSKGRQWAGKVFEPQPHQVFVLANVFGWLRTVDGLRRFRTVYEEEPRKNGKTTKLAGVGLYGLVADGEPGAEIYSCATKRDQAIIMHSEAIRMVRASKSLSTAVRIFKNNLNIKKTNSRYEPLGADADTLDGLNIHFALVDEVHAHKSRDLWDVLETGTGSRQQPLIWAITTAGFQRESICKELREYLLKILSGVIEDDTFFGIIHTIDDGDDWQSEDSWRKANPNYGLVVLPDDLRRLAAKAKESPAALNNFLRKRLNVWTAQETRWINREKWLVCGRNAEPISWRKRMLDELKRARCVAGLDLGSVSDLTALVLEFTVEDRTVMIPWFWVPENGRWRKDIRHSALYEAWIRQGFITPTDGEETDYAQIRADIARLAAEFAVAEIAVDRLFQGAQLCQDLMADGHKVIAFGQGFLTMAAPTRAFEELYLGGKLDHGNNPVLNWMADNVEVKTDEAGNMKPVKPGKTSPYKVDGIVAAIMAHGRTMVSAPIKPSVYEDRGLRVL